MRIEQKALTFIHVHWRLNQIKEVDKVRIWDPFSEMEQTMRELQPVLENLLLGGGTSTRPVAFLPGKAARAYPRINVNEDQENVYVEAVAPGISAEALQITVVGNTLTISGEKPGPGGMPVEAFYANERAAGKFVRTIEVPVEVDSNRTEALYANGVLTITLPKAEKVKPKQIQVSVN